MRKWTKLILLACVFAALLCGSALAADVTGAGFYDVKSNTDLKVEAVASDSSVKVEKVSADVDSIKAGYETFYVNSDKLNVTYIGTAAEKQQYLVLLVQDDKLPTADSQIYYIDQQEGSADFVVYPRLPTSGATTMTLFITSDDPSFTTKSVTLGYAANGTYKRQPYLLGDADGNGEITAMDASTILQRVVGSITLTDTQMLAADVDLAGGLTAMDASYILQRVVGTIKDFSEIQKAS